MNVTIIDTIPITIIRGGSSKGIFFKKVEGKGHGDVRQIDGLGGANSLTAKIAVVNKSDDPNVDLDYHFYQVALGKGELSDSQNCGNILAGVVPFALQEKMCEANGDQTTKIVKMLNSNSICEVTVETPNGVYNPNGETYSWCSRNRLKNTLQLFRDSWKKYRRPATNRLDNQCGKRH